MRKVVDSNYLRADEFKQYLAQSRHNYAILTDYAAKEAYKNQSTFGSIKTLQIACDYAEQILVLRNTSIIVGIKCDSSGLQKRLIDQRQTDDFRNFAATIRKFENDNGVLEALLSKHRAKAREEIEQMLVGASLIQKQLGVYSHRFSKEERDILRCKGNYTAEMKHKLTSFVLEITRELYILHNNQAVLKRCRDVRNSLTFRLALCMLLLDLKWGIDGGGGSANPETIRNDMIDMYFAAYATYFDGLLTKEKKQMLIYQQAVYHLNFTFI